jgi:cytochrome o ubiquinol oxidase subunit III
MTATKKHTGLNLGESHGKTNDAAEEVIFGFWIFLMSDLVLFALLFATYADMSLHGIASGPTPHDIVELKSAAIETGLLLASSFTFGMASLALKYHDSRKPLILWLGATFMLGAAFVGMELRDFHLLVSEHHAPPQLSGYLSAFYLLLGTHGLHVTAGLLWLLVMLVQIVTLGLVREVKLRIMRLALFWHMLDIVWICIFTFVYLYGALR